MEWYQHFKQTSIHSIEAYLKPEDLQQKEAICVDPIRKKMRNVEKEMSEFLLSSLPLSLSTELPSQQWVSLPSPMETLP